MPYRRLPNTDVARLRALKIAYVKGKELPPFKLAYTSATYTKVQALLPQFEHALMVHKSAYNSQVNKSRDYVNNLKKAKLYISHFIQVVNMAIARGDMPANTRTFYGMEENETKVPQLNTEADVIKWGELIIKGETDRSHKGLTPVTNPTIALVKVRFENFMDSYNFQKTLQKNNTRTHQELTGIREQVDKIIARVWDEVEETFNQLPDDLKREKAKEYGLIYVFRKNELRRISLPDNTLGIRQA